MNVPSNLKYTKEHEWYALKAITPLWESPTLLRAIRAKLFLEVVWAKLNQGDVFGSVEAVKTVLTCFACWRRNSGIQRKLEDAPELVNSDPKWRRLDGENCHCRCCRTEGLLRRGI